VELQVRTDPLPIQVDAGDRVTIVAADDAVGVQHGDEDEGIELAQEFGLFAVRAQKIQDSFEYCARRGLSAVHSRRDNDVRLLFQVFRVARNRDLPHGESADCPA